MSDSSRSSSVGTVTSKIPITTATKRATLSTHALTLSLDDSRRRLLVRTPPIPPLAATRPGLDVRVGMQLPQHPGWALDRRGEEQVHASLTVVHWEVGDLRFPWKRGKDAGHRIKQRFLHYFVALCLPVQLQVLRATGGQSPLQKQHLRISLESGTDSGDVCPVSHESYINIPCRPESLCPAPAPAAQGVACVGSVANPQLQTALNEAASNITAFSLLKNLHHSNPGTQLSARTRRTHLFLDPDDVKGFPFKLQLANIRPAENHRIRTNTQTHDKTQNNNHADTVACCKQADASGEKRGGLRPREKTRPRVNQDQTHREDGAEGQKRQRD
ncbi:hypothetical protein EYF80_009180 [Liparis tanakae]|uniref:Uncharacterized protein n=1 Tax=Liparis tanakae TaxID=230148 RepID=A0A4Z2ITP2_9TELE|nr:hypothetical protein EYF80_009180 [Liparis tanakae]